MIFALIVIVAAVITASADLSRLASLDSSLVLSGEAWRIFSGHLSHLTWNQFFFDATAFIFLYQAYSHISGTISAVFLLFFSSFIVSVGVIISGIHQVYGGLSGLSCAAISAIILITLIKSPGQVIAYLLAVVFCIYLFFMRGQGLSHDISVAWEAHIAGAIAGAIFVLMHIGFKKIYLNGREHNNKRVFK